MSNLAKKILAGFFLTVGLLTGSFAAGTPLPADQAFAVSASFSRPNEVTLEWRVTPGYYLYAKKIHITLPENAAASTIKLPQGEMRYDDARGGYEALSGNFSLPISLKTADQAIQLSVEYQGCSKDGFCYPPMQQNLLLNLTDQTITKLNDSKAKQATPADSFQSLLKDQNSVQALLQTQHISMLLLIFTLLGLLLAFTPCVLPMIPILTGIIVGQKQTASLKKAFFLSLAYVLGAAIMYAIAGLIAASMGNSLQALLQKPIIIFATSGLFVLLALSLFGLYELRIPNSWQNYLVQASNKQRGGSYAGVFIMGMLSTLIVSPCVTAPLVGVLMYIGQTGDRVLGASALFAMGIGMGIPLLLIGVSAGRWLPKSGPWMEVVKKLFGLIMLAMALWLVSRIVSGTVMLILWGALLLFIAGFLIYLPHLIGRRALSRGLGFLVGCSGMLLMLGGIGKPEMVNDLLNAHYAKASQQFTVVKNITDIDKNLALAKAAHKPVILDFYADWCESCIIMDRGVFNKSDVIQDLKSYVLLRADLTENTENDEQILKRFNVIAPPTVLFFDAEGRELNRERIVGEVDAAEFLTRLQNIRSQFVFGAAKVASTK